MVKFTRMVAISLALTLMFVSLIGASAMVSYPEELPDNGDYFRCKYCHVSRDGGGDPNQFGIDFKENNYTYDDTLGAMDSDDDGFTNDEEFSNDPLTNAGDQNSIPGEDLTMFNTYLSIGFFVAVLVLTALIWKPGGGPPAETGRKKRPKPQEEE